MQTWCWDSFLIMISVLAAEEIEEKKHIEKWECAEVGEELECARKQKWGMWAKVFYNDTYAAYLICNKFVCWWSSSGTALCKKSPAKNNNTIPIFFPLSLSLSLFTSLLIYVNFLWQTERLNKNHINWFCFF